MSKLKLTIDLNNKPLAAAIGRALTEYATEDPQIDLSCKSDPRLMEPAPENATYSDEFKNKPVYSVSSDPRLMEPAPVTETVEPDLSDDEPTAVETGDITPADLADEYDSNGLPWDERINTSNRGQTSKGVWKRKPGLDQNFYNDVIAELRGAQPKPVDEKPAEQIFTPPAEPVADGGTLDFKDLFSLSTTAINNGSLTMDQLDGYSTVHNVPKFIMIGSLPEPTRSETSYKIAKDAGLI